MKFSTKVYFIENLYIIYLKLTMLVADYLCFIFSTDIVRIKVNYILFCLIPVQGVKRLITLLERNNSVNASLRSIYTFSQFFNEIY